MRANDGHGMGFNNVQNLFRIASTNSKEKKQSDSC